MKTLTQQPASVGDSAGKMTPACDRCSLDHDRHGHSRRCIRGSTGDGPCFQHVAADVFLFPAPNRLRTPAVGERPSKTADWRRVGEVVVTILAPRKRRLRSLQGERLSNALICWIPATCRSSTIEVLRLSTATRGEMIPDPELSSGASENERPDGRERQAALENHARNRRYTINSNVFPPPGRRLRVSEHDATIQWVNSIPRRVPRPGVGSEVDGTRLSTGRR